MNKRIFFTGASGFAGKLLAKYLRKKKFEVTKVIFKSFKHKNKKSIKVDLTKKIHSKKKFDWIIHAAAHHKVKDFKNKPKIKAKRNILMVKNLIEFAKKNKVENFIFFFNNRYKLFPISTKKKNLY